MASATDRGFLAKKAHKEGQIYGMCVHLARTVYNLKMSIRGVAFQIDGTKLTVFYMSDERVDFRSFVNELFGIYHVRIWMQKVSPKDMLIDPYSAVSQSLATGVSMVSF